MNSWVILIDIVVLLAGALVLGMLFERLKQSAVIGYMFAGLIFGPGGLAVVQSGEQVGEIAELGVALLLFTIGLEFSWSRLRQLGSVALFGGLLQIAITGAGAALAGVGFGLSVVESIVIGAAVALSSTAVVLRILADRAELDSLRGRNALGILLLQDLAVVPLVLVVSALGKGGSGSEAVLQFLVSVGQAIVLVGAVFLVSKYVFPRTLHLASVYRNRDLPVVLAMTIGLGAAVFAHTWGLSAILGTFAAGMILAESPFAEQIRADIIPLRSAFLTLFFTSAGMLATLPKASNWIWVGGLALAIILGKALVITVVVMLFRQPLRTALASGLALAQIGEFSFVLLELARADGIIAPEMFRLLLSASLVTLIVTPYVIAVAPKLGEWFTQTLPGARPGVSPASEVTESDSSPHQRVIIVGYGPAGRRLRESLESAEIPFVVVDLNPNTVAALRTVIPIEFGDAARPEILHHLHVEQALGVVVTIPDPQMAGLVIRQVKRLAPETPVIARARYHLHRENLQRAGAQNLVDEEELVGLHLANEIIHLHSGDDSRAERPIAGSLKLS